MCFMMYPCPLNVTTQKTFSKKLSNDRFINDFKLLHQAIYELTKKASVKIVFIIFLRVFLRLTKNRPSLYRIHRRPSCGEDSKGDVDYYNRLINRCY